MHCVRRCRVCAGGPYRNAYCIMALCNLYCPCNAARFRATCWSCRIPLEKDADVYISPLLLSIFFVMWVLEEVVSARLLSLARTGVLLIDPVAHAEAQRLLDQASLDQESEAYQRVRAALASIRQASELTVPIYTLTDYDPVLQRARVVVVSDTDESLQPGALLPVEPEAAQVLGWTFEDGFARSTPIYWKWNAERKQREQWMTAFAPIVDAAGKTIAVVAVEHQGALFSYWFEALSLAIVLACVGGGLIATAVGIGLAWHVTRPIRALTGGVE